MWLEWNGISAPERATLIFLFLWVQQEHVILINKRPTTSQCTENKGLCIFQCWMGYLYTALPLWDHYGRRGGKIVSANGGGRLQESRQGSSIAHMNSQHLWLCAYDRVSHNPRWIMEMMKCYPYCGGLKHPPKGVAPLGGVTLLE